MSTQDVDALFRRYAQRGDAEALGLVFDATWAELFRVALHFVERPDEAEDLVQATWLTAIEKSGEHDPERRLMPWLVGVLALHARELTTKRRRVIDPLRLEQREPEPSDARAESIELTRAVREALASVPESYRDTLQSYLVDGRKAVEIALERGQRPATVRMQLHRGLEHLRKALPASLALGGALALTPTRGMAAVREQVLARAGEFAVASTASTSGVLLGTTLVMKKIVVALALLLALCGLGYWLWPAPAAAVNVVASNAAAPADSTPAAPADFPTASVVQRAEREAAVEQQAGASTSSSERLAAFLASCSGRVIESDGKPVPSLDVALLDAEVADLLGPLDALALVRDVARTDSEGRFTLRHARPSAVHALVVDPGGPRATLRLVDAQLGSGTTVDIGDVRLAAGEALSGEVHDAAGAPLAGARVIAVPTPNASLGTAVLPRILTVLQDLLAAGPDERTAIGFVDADSPTTSVLSIDAGSARVLQRVPLPTVTTDAAGRFHFEALEAGAVTLVVTAASYAGNVLAVDSAARGAAPVRVELQALCNVAVRVVDAAGRPFAGVELLALAHETTDRSSVLPVVLQRLPPSDAEGRSMLRASAATRTTSMLVRRNEHESWTIIATVDLRATVEIRLPAACSWSARVTDEAGAAIEGAQLQLVSREEARAWLGSKPATTAPSKSDRALVSVRDLTPGAYLACVSAPGFVGQVRDVELSVNELDARAEFRLARGGPLEIEIVDAATGQPIADASVVSGLDRELCTRTTTSTDERGRATLPLWLSEGARTQSLEVRHPAYASQRREPTQNTPSPLRIALDHGGQLEARLLGGAPDASFTLALHSRNNDLLLARISSAAPLQLEGLPAGEWQYALTPALGIEDTLRTFAALATPQSRPLAEGVVEIVAGQRTSVTVAVGSAPDLTVPPGLLPEVPTGNCTLSGYAFLDGKPAVDYAFNVALERGNMVYEVGSTPVGADGQFELRNQPAGKLVARLLRRGVRGAAPAWHDARKLADGETASFDIQLQSCAQPVRVVDERGAPVRGVDLSGFTIARQGNLQHATTDADGRARMLFFAEGETHISARHPEFGSAEATVQTIFGRELAPLELRLSVGVPCAGELRCKGLEFSTKRDARLIVAATDRGFHVEQPLPEVATDTHFRVQGLSPGKYVAMLWTGQEMSAHTPFELGPNGDEQLELVMRPQK